MKNKRWRQAIVEEIKATEKNNTWESSTLSKDHEAIGVKWVYKTKENANGDWERSKASLLLEAMSKSME